MFSQPHSHYLSYCRCGISRKSAGVLCGAGAFRSVVAGALLLFSLVLLVPQCAFAATWPVAGHRPSPSLGFHETYTAGISENRSYVHSGIDAPGSAGSQIVSPIAGTVCFTGSVPSGDSVLAENLSMEAILLAAPDWIFVTTMGLDNEAAMATLQAALLDNPAWSTLTAVREGRYVVLDPMLFHYRPNERWAEAYEQIVSLMDGTVGNEAE